MMNIFGIRDKANKSDITSKISELENIICNENYMFSFDDVIDYKTIAIESDDPFDEVITDDTPEETTEEDASFDSSSEDDPFDSIGNDDFFGDDSETSDEKPKKKDKKISRKNKITESYDISRSIRKVFPSNFIHLITEIDNNIKTLEHLSIDSSKLDLVSNLIKRYSQIRNLISDYTSIIGEETYENIFSNYVVFYGICYKLKRYYLEHILEVDKDLLEKTNNIVKKLL